MSLSLVLDTSKVWMLTGDKLETAICIAKSSKMVSRLHDIYVFQSVTDRSEAHLELNALRRKSEAALIITGDSLQVNKKELSILVKLDIRFETYKKDL